MNPIQESIQQWFENPWAVMIDNTLFVVVCLGVAAFAVLLIAGWLLRKRRAAKDASE